MICMNYLFLFSVGNGLEAFRIEKNFVLKVRILKSVYWWGLFYVLLLNRMSSLTPLNICLFNHLSDKDTILYVLFF